MTLYSPSLSLVHINDIPKYLHLYNPVHIHDINDCAFPRQPGVSLVSRLLLLQLDESYLQATVKVLRVRGPLGTLPFSPVPTGANLGKIIHRCGENMGKSSIKKRLAYPLLLLQYMTISSQFPTSRFL